MRDRVRLAGLLVITAVSFSVAGAQEPLRIGLVESELVDRVSWPVRLRPLTPGGCDGLDPGVLEVKEDGLEMRVTDLEERRLPTIHALLIDTSGSMEMLFGGALAAARDYVRAVPPQDRTLIVGFDENLHLRAGPTSDGELAVDALLRLEAAHNRFTALWDAIYHVVGFLDGLEARKVLVLVTDGCDSTSLPIHTFETVMARIESTSGLTILPLVIGRGATCSSKVGTFVPTPDGTIPLKPGSAMEALGRRSGGEMFRIGSGEDLADAFASIVERLRQEGTVVWSGVPFGEGPKDNAGKQDSRRRKLRIGGRLKGLCEAENAGPPVRLVSRNGPSERPRQPRFQVREGRLTGPVTDLVLERGHLYEAERSREQGRLVVGLDRGPKVTERNIEVVLPPVAVESATRPDPARLILEALQPRSGGLQNGPESLGTLLQGQAFFYFREDLARALLATPVPGAWARRRIHQERERFANEILAEAAAKGTVSKEAERRVREAILGRPVTATEVLRYLGAWLGDLDAAELAHELERRALVDPTDVSPDTLRRTWPALVRAFAPPTTRRVITWLHPVYDPGQDAVGFWRVHLPRPEEGRLPLDAIPSRPVGLEVIEWARGPDGLPSFAGDVAVTGVDYRPASAALVRRFNEWLYQEKRPERITGTLALWKMSVRLVAPASAGGARESAILDVAFPMEAEAYGELAVDEQLSFFAYCIDVRPMADDPDAPPLAGRLRRELRERGRDCPA